MKKYEYKTELIDPWNDSTGGFFPDSDAEIEFLNKLGKEFWELVCVTSDPSKKTRNIYDFKRAIPN